jgi:hypothetical protein
MNADEENVYGAGVRTLGITHLYPQELPRDMYTNMRNSENVRAIRKGSCDIDPTYQPHHNLEYIPPSYRQDVKLTRRTSLLGPDRETPAGMSRKITPLGNAPQKPAASSLHEYGTVKLPEIRKASPEQSPSVRMN